MADAKSPKQQIVVSLPGIEVNLSCLAFWLVGTHFEEAAVLFKQAHEGFSLVPYFLLCQAIELGLKAFLLLKKSNRRQLRTTDGGHNLTKLLATAEQRGLANIVSFTPDEKAVIDTVSKHYAAKGDRGKQLQYMDFGMALKGFKELPDLDPLYSIAKRLLHNAELEAAYLAA